MTTPPRFPSIYVWADGTWCWDYELEDMSHGKSDDYRKLEVTDACDDEEAERIAFNYSIT